MMMTMTQCTATHPMIPPRIDMVGLELCACISLYISIYPCILHSLLSVAVSLFLAHVLSQLSLSEFAHFLACAFPCAGLCCCHGGCPVVLCLLPCARVSLLMCTCAVTRSPISRSRPSSAGPSRRQTACPCPPSLVPVYCIDGLSVRSVSGSAPRRLSVDKWSDDDDDVAVAFSSTAHTVVRCVGLSFSPLRLLLPISVGEQHAVLAQRSKFHQTLSRMLTGSPLDVEPPPVHSRSKEASGRYVPSHAHAQTRLRAMCTSARRRRLKSFSEPLAFVAAPLPERKPPAPPGNRPLLLSPRKTQTDRE